MGTTRRPERSKRRFRAMTETPTWSSKTSMIFFTSMEPVHASGDDGAVHLVLEIGVRPHRVVGDLDRL
jgi:uncharacterized Rossmann fold enzyme